MTEATAQRSGHPRAAVLSSLGAVLFLVGGWTLAQWLQQPDFSPVRESISALAATGTPHRWAMTTALVLTGVMHVITAWCLPGMHRSGRLVLAAAGVATVGVAAVPLPARGESSLAHTAVAVLSFVLLAAWPAPATHSGGRGLLHPRVARIAAVVLLLLVASMGLTLSGSVFGLHERIVAALLALWPFATAAVAWWRAGWPIGSPRSKHVLSTAGFAALAMLGGITATNLAPVTAQTDYYQATVSLSPDPRDIAEVLVPTIFGDLTMSFRGTAPGVAASPQIRQEITDALARPGMSASSLQPTQGELAGAVRSAAVQLGVRVLVGALLTATLLLVAYVLVRHRRPRRWLFVSTLTGALVATLWTAVSMVATYRVDRQPTFATTGVLTAVQTNLDILDDVEARSAQVAPYLRNLVVLSGALQEKYTDQAPDREVALRVLLVSDMHGANYYPLMRSIVEEAQIDVVVDTGDIVNFGSPAELDASGLRDGIASLGVPYLFVRGNHDARSELDYGVVDAIASVPNGYVLQPAPDRYAELDLGGLRIAGFNDPRYFGDSGAGSAERQQPAREQFEAAFDGRRPIDLLVSHEPWAVRDVPDVGVAVHGHMHSADLEGHRVQAGTFTGGGPFSHFRESQPGEELSGQPYAFDVLTFGTDCRLSTLMRYQYQNIVQGRPAYDDISLVNGSRVDTRPVDEDRMCRPPTRITQRAVQVSSQAGDEGG
ncbi:MAG: DUF998 domain-containing protein [Dermatophilaceae bacterium]|nr:DUF998 domain-containing protein [Intrasporangiaceae bacterium]